MASRNSGPQSGPPTGQKSFHESAPITPQPSATDDVECDIGVWGKTAAGKTALLAAMLYALKAQKVTKDFFASPPTDILPGLSNGSHQSDLRTRSEAFLEQIEARFLDGHNGGLGGTEVKRMEPMLFYIGNREAPHRKIKRGLYGRFSSLYLMDAAGLHILESDPTHDYWRHLQRTRGILMVFDGLENEHDRQSRNENNSLLVTNFLKNMAYDPGNQDALRNDKFLAICITRADQIAPKGPAYAHTFNTKGKLEAIIGKDKTAELLQVFPNNKIFLSSAMGWLKVNGEWRPNSKAVSNGTGQSLSIVDQRQEWRPYNCAHPLLWLIDRIDEVSIRKREGLLNKWFLNNYVYGKRVRNTEIISAALDQEQDVDMRVYFP